ncbi:MAG: SUMF1/EgtB/PvdO family nonheme iron enzyme [Chloroflexi bacterium]|nr:SUMF1/EgtB/PvdO family nonheme iron enzyme [Chloroflexota bacterium]
MPTKFFITHSWNDIDFARRLFKDLTASGLDGWMDDSAVRGGQRLAEEINRGLEGCDVYLSIMSPAALDSPWCWEEINAAITLANRHGRDRQLSIVSIIAAKCELPALLSSRLYFDFVERYDDALKELLTKSFGVNLNALLSHSVHPSSVASPNLKPSPKPNLKPPTASTPPRTQSAEKTEPTPIAHATTPEELEMLYLEALEAFHLEKWQLAADAFRRVIVIQSDYEDAAAKLQLAERALHETELSELYDGATKLIEESKWRAAIEQLEMLLKIDGGYRDARARLASAQNMLEAADLYMQASEAVAAEKWNEAVRSLEALLTIAPNYQDAAAKLTEAKRWAQLPDVYRRALKAIDVKQWQDAKTLLEQIQSVDANYRESKTLLVRVRDSALAELYDLASKAIDAKEWEQAKALLEQIQSRAPNYHETSQRLTLVIKQIIPRTKIGKDGKEMILIPAGEFLMGSNDYDNEKPPHKVSLDAFYISKYPVTNAEYKKFVDATKQSLPSHWENSNIPRGKENHPVVNMNWNDAAAYARWVGARLPTEAEWEKTASWDDAEKEKLRYPWGNEFDAKKCNTSESGIRDTTPARKYSPQGDSPYGVCDMAGNVWEWCSSLYKPYPYKHDDGRENPEASDARVLRGGAWVDFRDGARCAFRRWVGPHLRGSDVGIRVAESVS